MTKPRRYMGDCFLYGQGGSGGAKKIKGWVTKHVGYSFESNLGSTPVLVDSIALDGEIATIRLMFNTSKWFFDYVNGYYLSGYSNLANAKRNTLTEDEMILIDSDSDYNLYLYVKKNGKNLEVYGSRTAGSGTIGVYRNLEIGYL